MLDPVIYRSYRQARPVLTVALNAAVDKTLTVRGFAIGQSFTAENVRSLPGGKGINVARVLTTLGTAARILGFAGGPTGEVIRQGLDAEHLPHRLTLIDDTSRVCTAIMDPDLHTTTEANEAGPQVTASELQEFVTDFRLLVPHSGAVALSGSLPPGLRPSVYAELINLAWEEGIASVLDCSGPALLAGLEAGPLLVKPNKHEAELLTGQRITTLVDAGQVARSLLERGPLLVAISLGADGAVLYGQRGGWSARVPALTPVNTVGCGDAFVAGFLSYVLSATLPGEDAPSAIPLPDGFQGPDLLNRLRDDTVLSEALRQATACGAANALTSGAGEVRLDDVQRLRSAVQIAAL